MKISIKKLFCIILAVTMLPLIAGCKNEYGTSDTSDSPDATTQESEVTMDDIMEAEEALNQDYDNGIAFEEESDGADIVASKKASSDFIGTWTATSGQAMYQYGNVDIEIKDGGKWSGNISDEDLSGKWTETDGGLHLTSDIFDCDLVFTESGSLVMRYSPNEDGKYLNTVLTKQ